MVASAAGVEGVELGLHSAPLQVVVSVSVIVVISVF